MFCWISHLDCTPKMPVFHFLNLNNKYVFLLSIRWFALSWKTFDQFFFTAHEPSHNHTLKLQSSSMTRNLIEDLFLMLQRHDLATTSFTVLG